MAHLITILSLLVGALAGSVPSSFCGKWVVLANQKVDSAGLSDSIVTKLKEGGLLTLADVARDPRRVNLRAWEVEELRRVLGLHGLGFGETLFSARVAELNRLSLGEKKKVEVSELPLSPPVITHLLEETALKHGTAPTLEDLLGLTCRQIIRNRSNLDVLAEVVEVVQVLGFQLRAWGVCPYKDDVEELAPPPERGYLLPKDLLLSASELQCLSEKGLPIDRDLFLQHPLPVMDCLGWDRFNNWKAEFKAIASRWNVLKGTREGYASLQALRKLSRTEIESADVAAADFVKPIQRLASRGQLKSLYWLAQKRRSVPDYFKNQSDLSILDLDFRLQYLGLVK